MAELKTLNGYEIVDNLSRTSFYNPNLLLNSNFSNVINQRRQTTYTGPCTGVITIDRWHLLANNSLTVSNGYVRLSVTAATPVLLMYQVVESKHGQIPATMTLRFRAKASVKSKMQLYNTNRYLEIGTDWVNYSITFTSSEIDKDNYTDNGFNIWLGIKDYNNPGTTNLPVGTTFDVQWAKLEYGSIPTHYEVPDPGEELKKCQRYFVKFNSWAGAVPIRGDNVNVLVYLPYIMRTNPTVKYPGLQYGGVTKDLKVVYGTMASSSSVTGVQYNSGLVLYYPIGTNSILEYGTGVFTQDLELDANI